MNTPYDFTESAALLEKLFGLTRDGKIEWQRNNLVSRTSEIMTTCRTTLDKDLDALIWSNDKAAGFRLSEKPDEASYIPEISAISGRDLLSISINHDHGAEQGAVYVLLMGLLELARRSVDKVEPKIDRAKQYLDKLAV